MPRDQHYRQAGALLSDVLGADAADQAQVYQQSIDQMARLFELAEAYQDHVFGKSGNAAAGPDSPRPRPTRSAA